MHKSESSSSSARPWSTRMVLVCLGCLVIVLQFVFLYYLGARFFHIFEATLDSTVVKADKLKRRAENAARHLRSELKDQGHRLEKEGIIKIEEDDQGEYHFGYPDHASTAAADAADENVKVLLSQHHNDVKKHNDNDDNNVGSGSNSEVDKKHDDDALLDFEKLDQAAMSEFANVHTHPLHANYNLHNDIDNNNHINNNQRKRQQPRSDNSNNDYYRYPPLAKEAHSLLGLYSDIPPSTADDDFFASNEVMQSLRPEAVDLLRRVQTLNKRVRDGRMKKRVVVVHPVGQLCNRLVSISSAFVFALLTKRALFVDDTDFYCRSSDLFLEPGFPWVSGGRARLDGAESIYGGGGGGGGVPVVLENPEQGPWEMAEPLLCTNYSNPETRFGGAPTVVFRTNQYVVPYMSRNPTYRNALESLFPSSMIMTMMTPHTKHGRHHHLALGGVIHAISHFLFRPLPSLIAERDRFIKKHFDGHFVVGLQVRAGSDFTEHAMTVDDWRLYRDCALASTPPSLRGGGGTNNNEDHHHHHHGQQGADDKKVKFFVATDTAQGRERAKQILGADRVVTGPGEFLLSNNPRGVQMALLDLLLLEKSDDRVATAWSTFGYFAAGRSGLPSNLVVDEARRARARPGEVQRYMGIKHKSDKRRQCVRLPTVQPCFHHFENWGASKTSCAQKQWLEEEMLNGRYC